VAYFDGFPLSWDLREARLAPRRELQTKMQEELSALMPSVLDRAFKGELSTPAATAGQVSARNEM